MQATHSHSSQRSRGNSVVILRRGQAAEAYPSAQGGRGKVEASGSQRRDAALARLEELFCTTTDTAEIADDLPN